VTVAQRPRYTRAMVKLRPSRNGRGWEYDIIFRWPEGDRFRERRDVPVSSRSDAQRYADARQSVLLARGRAAFLAAKVPTLAKFWPRMVRDHYRAERKKPSTIDAVESIFTNHLAGPLGARPLDSITNADVAALKSALAGKGAKTVNNIVSVLSRTLRCAVDWGVLGTMPCKVRLLKVSDSAALWYERADYRRLVDAAKMIGTHVHVLVLLAGDAGLRRGELQALKWTDLDFERRLVHVQRAFWRDHEGVPKGGRSRIVYMTPELAAALEAHGSIRGERVLVSEQGNGRASNRTVRHWMGAAIRKAGLPVEAIKHREPKNPFDAAPCKRCKGTLRRTIRRGVRMTSLCVTCERRRRAEGEGPIHRLRHTFCSHLAAAGAPASAIQELAGHADLKTTQRYVHLAPGLRSEPIAALARYHAGEKPPTSPDANRFTIWCPTCGVIHITKGASAVD
jgi:integrase